MDPVLSQSISFHRKGFVDFVPLAEPINASSWARLPFHTEGMSTGEVGRSQLMSCTDSIGLKGLRFCSRDWFIRFRYSQVRSIEKGINRCIAMQFQAIVPALGKKLRVAIFGQLVLADWLGSSLWAITGDTRGNLCRKNRVRVFTSCT